MNQKEIDFFIRKLSIEDVNSLDKLKRYSISQINSVDYTAKQVQVLIKSHSKILSFEEISTMINIGATKFPQIVESEHNIITNIVACVRNLIIGCASISDLSPFSNFQTLQELLVHHE